MIQGTPPNLDDALIKLELYKKQNPQYNTEIDSVIDDVKSVEGALEYQEVADISTKVLQVSGFSALPDIEPIIEYLKSYFKLRGMQLKYND